MHLAARVLHVVADQDDAGRSKMIGKPNSLIAAVLPVVYRVWLTAKTFPALAANISQSVLARRVDALRPALEAFFFDFFVVASPPVFVASVADAAVDGFKAGVRGDRRNGFVSYVLALPSGEAWSACDADEGAFSPWRFPIGSIIPAANH